MLKDGSILIWKEQNVQNIHPHVWFILQKEISTKVTKYQTERHCLE